MVLEKGSLVWGIYPPIRGEGYPGPAVLGIVYTHVEEGTWVKYPGGHLCLFRSLDLESAD